MPFLGNIFICKFKFKNFKLNFANLKSLKEMCEREREFRSGWKWSRCGNCYLFSCMELNSFISILSIFIIHTYYIRVLNQECEAINKIWRNEVTDARKVLKCRSSILVFRLADLKIQPSTDNWKHKKVDPVVHFPKVLFPNKWLKTTDLQLSQKSFKTSLRKLTIIASFNHHNLLFNFFLIEK